MTLAYENELAFRTIERLISDPRSLRHRLPDAWNEGMGNIVPEALPETVPMARNRLIELREELNQRTCSHRSNAAASLSRKHDKSIAELARKMMDVSWDLERALRLVEGTNQ
jgi:hypothetical protein